MKKVNDDIRSPALGCKLGRAYQVMLSQLGRALRDAGLDLSTSEYLVMRAVYSCPGAQQCEIADMVGKNKAAVCRSVAGLEKKGLLRTESVSYKCLKVYPSEEGRRVEARIMAVAAQRHRALKGLATQAELDVFTKILDNIINSK